MPVRSRPNHAGRARWRQGKTAGRACGSEKVASPPGAWFAWRMKWLLGFCIVMALAAAVLFVPVGGKTLWSRGAARQVALLVARGLRSGWDALASIDGNHRVATRAAPAHSPGSKPIARK